MSNPFSALKAALRSVFHLESMRNGKYIYPEVQQLKMCLDNFQPNKQKFIELLKALRASLPYIEKWHVDFNSIRVPLDSLAIKLQMHKIDWDRFLSHSNTSLKFQFSALNHKYKELELLPWLATKSGLAGTSNNLDMQIRVLLEYRDHFGFSQKLSAQLKKDPDFLFRLIMSSEKNFTEIAHTRLILYLTDKQLAEAILKYIPRFVQHNANPITQATKLVDKLNEILSNGRSVSTLLRNAQAKFILDSSELLQIYQNGPDLKVPSVTATNPPSSLEEGGLKPAF
jgi:hypothetical protein